LLHEPLSLRLVVTSMAILGGIALVIIDGRTAGRTSSARRAD
jgi:hypothetical protein